MKRNPFIPALIVAIGIAIIVLICLPKVQYGKSVLVTSRAGDKIVILGAETVRIKGTSLDYFRIVSGDSQLYGIPLADEEFENEGKLPTSEPLRITHGSAHYVISADTMMKVTEYQGANAIGPIISFVVVIIFLLILYFSNLL